MNEVTWREANENWTELMYAEDPGASYDFSDIVLFQKGAEYALFFDSGCSCYSAFEDKDQGGDVYTKEQLLKLISNWKDGGSERVMKEWVLENV